MMSDSEYDDCAVHAVVMAFYALGLLRASRLIQKLGSDFLETLERQRGGGGGTRSRGLKLPELVRFWRK